MVAGGFRWWLAAEKRKKKFGELSFLENFSAGGFRNVLAYFFLSFSCREKREERDRSEEREKNQLK